MTGRAGLETCVALLAGFVLAGCAGLPGPSYPIKDAGTALARRDATIAQVSSMRAEARVDQRAKQGRIRGTVLMIVERSGRVRFDVMTQFGPIAILTSDAKQFAYADFREKRYLTGETCPSNIARLLGVPLSAADTARFLLGGTPVLPGAKSELKLADEGSYRLTLRSPDGQRQELELAVYAADLKQPPDRQRLYLVRSELFNPKGSRVWRVTYDDAEPTSSAPDAVLMPRKVRIEQPASSSDTLVLFKQIKINPQVPDEAFGQTPRPGMEEAEALCDEPPAGEGDAEPQRRDPCAPKPGCELPHVCDPEAGCESSAWCEPAPACKPTS